ncbi:hypothetical protein OU995_18835 [Roseateles sp. SL47]|uniref:hypothetical protein n=1 Tax=Roseateles sp. SL47 TaxID=2995138 RepID=UPI00226EC4EC|nr:hypothetical protein [Roseateles sp. SL47]WAC71627.1 hypothetical protein OU995_18835 [Roseateles sp. SL47]
MTGLPSGSFQESSDGDFSADLRAGAEPEAFALNEHRQVWDTIPWVVAGSATPEQARMVQEHVVDCRHCSDELDYQEQIFRGMQDGPVAAEDEAAMSAGLQRLWAREEEAEAMAAGARRGPARNDELDLATATVVAGRSKNKRWLIMAVAVQAVAICVLGLRVMMDPQQPDFVTLSQPAALPPGAILRLVPDGNIDVNTLRRLLTQHSLRIVGADEEASSLLLAPLHPESIPASAAGSLAQHLRSEPGVVLVVPVGVALPEASR